MTTQSPHRRHWSPEPEDVTGARAICYRNDPYGASPEGKIFAYTMGPAFYPEYDAPMVTETEAPAEPPVHTLHQALWNRVSFVPYPTEEFFAPVEAMPAHGESLVRAFIGQLPYFVTEMEFAWMCYYFGGHVVVNSERIMKRQGTSGNRLPTGCIHGFATVEAVQEMSARMHKRMLIDDTGVWYAQTEEELRELNHYVAVMKVDKRMRVQGRPYDTVVVQLATSTFVPACPVPLTEFPTERPPQNMRKASPPPPYDATVDALPPPYGTQ